MEPLFRIFGEYLDSGSLLNIVIPVVGIYGQDLLVSLLSVMSVANVMSSFEKWFVFELKNVLYIPFPV